MPTQSTVNEMQNEATGTTASERNRKRALLQAKNDVKALWDLLRAATEKGADADVRYALVEAARMRLGVVNSDFEQIR